MADDVGAAHQRMRYAKTSPEGQPSPQQTISGVCIQTLKPTCMRAGPVCAAPSMPAGVSSDTEIPCFQNNPFLPYSSLTVQSHIHY